MKYLKKFENYQESLKKIEEVKRKRSLLTKNYNQIKREVLAQCIQIVETLGQGEIYIVHEGVLLGGDHNLINRFQTNQKSGNNSLKVKTQKGVKKLYHNYNFWGEIEYSINCQENETVLFNLLKYLESLTPQMLEEQKIKVEAKKFGF